MRFLNNQIPSYDLTYNDVFLVPQRSSVNSRFDVSLETVDLIGAKIPLVVANMSAVAGKRMAETVARRGGITILPQDIPMSRLKEMINFVKSRHLIFDTPLTLKPTDTINQATNILFKRNHGVVVIIDDDNHPLGLISERMIKDIDQFETIDKIIRHENMIVFRQDLNPKEMFEKMHQNHIKLAPIVDNDNRLIGILTKKNALRADLYQPAVDRSNKFLIGAAIGINGNVKQRAEEVLSYGVDLIVLDTAHGHQDKMIKAIEQVRSIGQEFKIVAGNVVTEQATEDLIMAGADIVKVGVGPGAMCTTRMATGVGRPQFSAVLECSVKAKSLGKFVWADGGIRYPRDVVLALAAGASNVMFASWLTGTFESAADIRLDSDGRYYKENFGMASRRAVSQRSNLDDPYTQNLKEFFEEGISNSKIYIDPIHPSVEDIIDRIVAGLRSALSYSGARNLETFSDCAIVGLQSQAGYDEGRPVNSNWQ